MSPDPIVYLGCVRRRTIELCIREVPRVTGRREYELDKFQALTGQITTALEQGQKTLIYFPTVSLLERFYTHCLAQRLGNAVTRYHAQLSGEAKAENLEDFRSGKRRIMLATKAFGMGIDIPDIALVLHFAPPVTCVITRRRSVAPPVTRRFRAVPCTSTWPTTSSTSTACTAFPAFSPGSWCR